ncbi:MAG: hypothetical protein J5542_12100 [Bacteroidales bacterium]|nr:hypothetical protein [Bacteroidales bacterium]
MAEQESVKPRSVELKNDEEREIKFYQKYLDGLAQGSSVSSEIFTNKGKAHASILMATLLANTTKKLKMYCKGLTPGILCGKKEGDGDGFEGAYWAEFKYFFKEKIKSIEKVEILLQEKTYLSNEPFKIIEKACEENKNKIEVKKITPESKEKIEKFLGNENGEEYNFAVFDDRAFRLEYKPEDYQAIGSFCNPTWCKMLSQLFDYAFKDAEDIQIETANDRASK